MSKRLLLVSLIAACGSIVHAREPQAAAPRELYRFVMIQAAPGKVPDLVSLYQKRAPDNRPEWLRTVTLSFPFTLMALVRCVARVGCSLAPFIPRPARWIVWGIALFVGIARIYVGAHFPLDVVGGLALGWLLASVVNLALGAEQPRGPQLGTPTK